MTSERTLILLGRIAEEAKDALSFVEDHDRAAFLQDRRTQHAVAMGLINIGETANRLAENGLDLSELMPSVDWRAARAMRNRIAHGYFNIDFEIVWDIVSEDIPGMLHAVSKEIDKS